jgi:hypothetical protein
MLVPRKACAPTITRSLIHPVLLALALGIGGAAPATGQQALLGPGAAYFSAGVSRIATAQLDDRLTARGYPTFGRTATSLGVGAYRTLANGVMLGGEAHGLIMGEEVFAGRVAGLGGGHATLGIGYMIELSPRARIYPRVGLGAGGLALWVESAADTVEFDEVLANPSPQPGRQPVLSHDGLVVDLGVGAELLPGGPGRGPLIGLRLGYLAAQFGSESDWQLYDRVARNGPPATIAGPYVRVVIGGAWRR